jgi:hypothetical protein
MYTETMFNEPTATSSPSSFAGPAASDPAGIPTVPHVQWEGEQKRTDSVRHAAQVPCESGSSGLAFDELGVAGLDLNRRIFERALRRELPAADGWLYNGDDVLRHGIPVMRVARAIDFDAVSAEEAAEHVAAQAGALAPAEKRDPDGILWWPEDDEAPRATGGDL